jgi:hypothetical protein
MLLFFTQKSWIFKVILILVFFSCSGPREYRIHTVWKFLAADDSQRVILYYLVEDNQLKLHAENQSEQQLNVEISLRIYDSHNKKNFFDTSPQTFSLPPKNATDKQKILNVTLYDISAVKSIDVTRFNVSNKSD